MVTHVQQHSRLVEKSPVFYGWIVWGVAFLALAATSPGQAYSISLFIDSYIEDFGLTRTTVSTLFSAGTFIAAFMLTFVGRAIDVRGNRRVGTVILIGYAVVLVLVSWINGPLTLLLSFILLRLLGMGALSLVSSTAIAQWWRVRRGWVAGLALVGFALSQRLYMPVVQQLIESVGWRQTWVLLGISIGLLMLPVWWLFMRDRPEHYGLLPDNAARRTKTDVGLPDEENWTLREVRLLPIFWIFIFGRMFVSSFGSGMIFHQVSIFENVGHTAAIAAATFGTTALVNALTTLLVGGYIRRVRPARLMAFQLGVLMGALYLTMVMRDAWSLTAYAVLFGVMMSIGGLFENTVWADLFGRENHGAIRGFATTALVIGTGIGPILFGLSYDLTGSYHAIIWAGILCALLPMMLSFTVSRPRARFATP
ncbi:MAG: MFS transporter [Anaerolineae bacterium]